MTMPVMSPNVSRWNIVMFALGLHWVCQFYIVCLLFLPRCYPMQTQFMIEFRPYFILNVFERVFNFLSGKSDFVLYEVKIDNVI